MINQINIYSKYLSNIMEVYKDTLIATQQSVGFPAPRKVKAFPKRKMKYTAGRNETCPCGSGNKFKKCCIGVED